MRQRRRAERQLSARSAAQGSAARRINQRLAQRLLYAGGALLLAALVVVLSVGWWLDSYRPPRKVVAEVDGFEVRLADTLPYTRLNAAFAGVVDPNLALNNLVRDHIVLSHAADIGADVGPEDVDAAIIRAFELVDEGSEPPAALTDAGRERLDNFLSELGVSESEHREWQAGALRHDAALSAFAERVEDSAESVFLEWIVASDSVQARSAYDRIEGGEEFSAVANEVNIDLVVADADGVVGWVPRGALQEIDPLLFAEDLELGAVMGPVATSVGSVVYRVTDRSDSQVVDEDMRRLLGEGAFQAWMNEQSLGVTLNLTAGDVAWARRAVEGS